MRKVQKVTGILALRPPMLYMFWGSMCSSVCSTPCSMPWMTEPEPRNSRALKKAWVTKWKAAAT